MTGCYIHQCCWNINHNSRNQIRGWLR